LTIQLARRLQRVRPSATVSITDKASELAARGRDIIRLSVGEPDFDTPAHIRQAAIAAIQSGRTKYTALGGAPDLKQAIRAKLARENGLEYSLEQIVVSNGAKQACFNLCQALLEPGDEVVIPAPYWVSYPDMVRLTGAEPVFVQMRAADRFRMTAEQLSAALTPATRLLVLNSPSNPTGSAYTPDELAAIGDVLVEHPKVIVLADEIYEHIYWGDSPLVSFAALSPALFNRTVTINGMSKGYAMSGWRIGFAAGPAELIRAMSMIQGQCTTSASAVSQAAAVAALEGDQTDVARMNAVFRERHDRVHAALSAIDGIDCPPGDGAFYLFPNIEAVLRRKRLGDDVAFCEALLDAEGVALVPGTAFGSPGHVRISFAAPDGILDAAVERITRFVTA
jgi:aspartate aminotransferase